MKYWRCLGILALIALFTYGCHDGCEPEATRCNGDVVEICNADEDWEKEADCSEIDDFGLDLDWTCCVDPADGLHSCLPADECNGVYDAGEDGD
jgi:hypothetical protein